MRGTLCNSCNVILSNYDDDPKILRAKAAELRAYSYPPNDGTLYFRVRRAAVDHKRARADIIDALAEYIERHVGT